MAESCPCASVEKNQSGFRAALAAHFVVAHMKFITYDRTAIRKQMTERDFNFAGSGVTLGIGEITISRFARTQTSGVMTP